MTAAQTVENHGDEWGMTVCLHIYDEGYINQLQTKHTPRIHWQQQKHRV